MGCDIDGRVEVRSFVGWVSVIDAGFLLDRNYDAYGMLFGVRHSGKFVPLAANRGLPEDASEEVKTEGTIPPDADENAWIFYHSPSWITLKEIQSIDWNEAVANEHKGSRQASETQTMTVTRREILGASFIMLFEMMEVLGNYYNSESVRLVVWFDG